MIEITLAELDGCLKTAKEDQDSERIRNLTETITVWKLPTLKLS